MPDLADQIPPNLSRATKITGIFGDPVSHSLSPKMHNYAFKKLGLDYTYLPFHVKPDELERAAESIRDLNIAGINVTIPHKEKTIELMDDVSHEATLIGAVNTVVNVDGKLSGCNTDAPGFMASLKEADFILDSRHTAVLWGAGGVSRAIVYSLLKAQVKKIILLNRTFERAKKLKDWLKGISPDTEIVAMDITEKSIGSELKHCDILINTTPAGIEDFPVRPDDFFSPNLFVYDAVYAKDTSFLTAARKSRAKCLGGLAMLIYQGALSFSLWTGKPVQDVAPLMKEGLHA